MKKNSINEQSGSGKQPNFFYFGTENWSDEQVSAYIEECRSAKDDYKLAEAYYIQGEHFQGSGLGDAQASYRKAIEHAKRSSNIHALAMAQFYLAMLTGEIEEHMRLAYSSLENIRKTEDRYMEAGILYQMGVWYHVAGDVSRALELWQTSIPIYERSDNPGGVAWALNGMARAAFQMGGAQEAIPFYEAAIEKSREYDLAASEIVALQALAELQLDLKNTDAAEAYLLRLIAIQPQPGAYDANVIEQLRARVLIAKGQEKKAEEILLRIRSTSPDSIVQTEVTRHLADLYTSQGRDTEAAALLEDTLPNIDSNTLGDLHTKVELAKIYERLGNSEKTLGLFNTILHTYETAFADDYGDKVTNLQKLLAAEKERSESMVLRAKSEQLERELMNSTLQLVAQTELLSELRDGLLQFIHKFPLPDGAAKELRERLKTLPCKAVDWEKFDTQFKSAHPEFMKTLLEKYPELTATEMRICSLVRMNLKSEDIARLLCLTDRTIESHRYNIRRKLNLKKEESLPLVLAKL